MKIGLSTAAFYGKWEVEEAAALLGGPEPKLRPERLRMGWVKGLEPSTPGTTIRCSNQLSYTHHGL